jgi:hypothetical protein
MLRLLLLTGVGMTFLRIAMLRILLLMSGTFHLLALLLTLVLAILRLMMMGMMVLAMLRGLLWWILLLAILGLRALRLVGLGLRARIRIGGG